MNTEYVIIYQGLAGQLIDYRSNAPPSGSYLKAFDPEFHDGDGMADWTTNRDKALKFSSSKEAFMFWRQVPKTKPLRADGRPNRPLTAYTIEIGTFKS